VTEALPDPLVRPEALRRLSEHVHLVPDGSRRGVPNIGVVVGQRRALVVDTGMGAANGRRALAAARRAAGERPLLLMTTHTHPEHDLGAEAFPASTVMLRARSQVLEIESTGTAVADDFRAASPHYRRLLEGAAFRPADIVFDDALDLDLGGVAVRLTAMGTNHTEGDTVALVLEDRVLFAGDLAMSGAPAFASPHSRIGPWLRSLERLRALDAGTIVPSHGPTGGAELIERYDVHLRRILDRVRELRVGGAGHDDVLRTVVGERIADFGDTGRLEGAVRAALREDTDESEGGSR
jgi:glyoxylase-like metal-dependent hydrolase (beta-lactamase superfamily II)